jgi:hypothetical protein
VDNRGFRVRGAERAPGAPAGPQGAVGAGAGGGRGDAAAGTGERGPGGGRGAPGAAGAAAAAGAGAGAGAAGGAATGGRGAGAGGGRGGQQQADVPPAQLDPDTSDRWADQTRIEGSRRFIAHRFPLLATAPVSQTHSCHYESTSSGNFIVDKHPDMSNAWIVAGGNSEGFKFCPWIGDYASKRITGIEGDPAVVKAFKIPEKEYELPAPPAAPGDSTRRPVRPPPGE